MAGRYPLEVESTPEVNPAGAPDAYLRIDANPSQFGGAIAQSEEHLGQGLQHAAAEGLSVAELQGQMDAKTHAAELHSWSSDQMTDESEKLLSMKGKAASMYLPEYKTNIEKIHQDALGQATNPYTKQLVNSEGRYLIDRNYALAARHAASEKNTWEAQTASNASDSYRSNAVLYATNSQTANLANDPLVENELFKSDQEARNYWSKQGYDGDALDGKVQAARGRGVTEIVKALASDESPTGIKRANDFYKSEENNIDAGSRIAIQNVLKGPLAKLAGVARTDEVLGRTTIPQNPLQIASRFVGAEEHAQRDTLSKFIGTVGGKTVDPVTTAWCAAFVNGVLREAGLQGSGSLAARSFLNVGQPVSGKPQEGDVVVLTRGDPSAGLGHVGFYAGEGSTPGTVRILAGNQGQKVAYAEYPMSQVLGIRHITAADIGQTPQIDAVAGRPLMSKGDAMLRLMDDPDLINRPPVMAAALEHLNKVYEAYHLQASQDTAAFKLKLNNTNAEALDTGTVKEPIGREEFIRNLGPEDGERAFVDYQANIQFGSDRRSTAGMTDEQITDLRKRYEPQPGTDYIAQSKRTAALDKAIADNDTAKRKDPADFIITRTDAGSQAFKQFQTLVNDPKSTAEMRQAYAGMFAEKMLSEQTRLGIDPADQRIVPKWYMDDISKKLADPNAEGGAQLIATTLQQQAQLWGSHWPQVYRQISADAQPIVRVLGSGVMPEAATALVNSFKTKEGDLLRNEENPTDTMKAVTAAVDTELAPFYRSLSGNKQDQTKTDFRTMATRLATVYLQNNTGMVGETGKSTAGNATEAARKAVHDLVGFKYDFRDTYRVPKDAGVGPDMVQAGSVEAKENLGKEGFEVASKRDDVGGLSPEYLATNTISSLQRNGVWLTDPQEKGLVLVQGNGMAARRPDGTPFVLTWKQLGDLGTKRTSVSQIPGAPL